MSRKEKEDAVITVTPEAQRKVQLIDALDLEPIVFKLVHPEPGMTDLTVEQADLLVLKYRRFLKLCAMYPDKAIVPSKELDPAWHTHILDTEKYIEDCMNVFGFVLHHFPYLGSRGPEDEALLIEKFSETRDLYRQHFGEDLFDGSIVDNVDASAAMCSGGGCEGGGCQGDGTGGIVLQVRPRIQRS
jgi:hypothetical protein